MRPAALPALVLLVIGSALAGCSDDTADPAGEATTVVTESPAPSDGASPEDDGHGHGKAHGHGNGHGGGDGHGQGNGHGHGHGEGQGHAGEGESTEADVRIEIEGNDVTPNGARLKAEAGDPMVLDIESDRAGELHVHSSPEQELTFGAGESTVEVTVDTPGIVDIEDHETGVVLVQLEVR
jgi:hypothetical protein